MSAGVLLLHYTDIAPSVLCGMPDTVTAIVSFSDVLWPGLWDRPQGLETDGPSAYPVSPSERFLVCYMRVACVRMSCLNRCTGNVHSGIFVVHVEHDAVMIQRV